MTNKSECVSDKLLRRSSLDLRRTADGEFVCNDSPRIVRSVEWGKAAVTIIILAAVIFVSFYAGGLYTARQSGCITVHVEHDDVAGGDLSERRFLSSPWDKPQATLEALDIISAKKKPGKPKKYKEEDWIGDSQSDEQKKWGKAHGGN